MKENHFVKSEIEILKYLKKNKTLQKRFNPKYFENLINLKFIEDNVYYYEITETGLNYINNYKPKLFTKIKVFFGYNNL